MRPSAPQLQQTSCMSLLQRIGCQSTGQTDGHSTVTQTSFTAIEAGSINKGFFTAHELN